MTNISGPSISQIVVFSATLSTATIYLLPPHLGADMRAKKGHKTHTLRLRTFSSSYQPLYLSFSYSLYFFLSISLLLTFFFSLSFSVSLFFSLLLSFSLRLFLSLSLSDSLQLCIDNFFIVG